MSENQVLLPNQPANEAAGANVQVSPGLPVGAIPGAGLPAGAVNSQAATTGAAKNGRPNFAQLRNKLPTINVKEKVADFVDRVENPRGMEAQQTFGYRPTAAEVERKNWRRKLFDWGWWFLALFLVWVVIALNWQTISNFFDFLTTKPEVIEVPVIETEPTVTTVSSIFEGKTRELGADMGWLRNEFFDDVMYYEAGEAVSGLFAGGKRYYVTGILHRDGSLRVYEFWQLTDGAVYLVTRQTNQNLWRQNLQDYYLDVLFSDQVKAIDQVASDFPQTLEVSNTMTLYRREVLTDLGPYDGAVAGAPRLELVLDPAYYESLSPLEARDYVDLKFYRKKYNAQELISQVANNLNLTYDGVLVEQYLDGGSKVVVVDKTGLAMVYELVHTFAWKNYERNLAQSLQSLDYYEGQLVRYTSTPEFLAYKQALLAVEPAELPAGLPQVSNLVTGLPGFSFGKNDFQFLDVSPLFSTYTSGYTANCWPQIDAKVLKNVSLDDLEAIGLLTVSNDPVYVLADYDHGLYQLAYDLKFSDNTVDDEVMSLYNQQLLTQLSPYSREELAEIEKGEMLARKPDYYQYVEHLPLLIVRDPWGQFLLLWENDITFLAECVI